MSTETNTTASQNPSQGNFDDSGKFIRAKRAKYSPPMVALIDRYNELVEMVANLDNSAAVRQLMDRADVSGKPAAIQSLVTGLRKALAEILEESKKNDEAGAEATLTTLRTQLTRDFEQKLAEAHEEYARERTVSAGKHDNIVSGKDARIASLNMQLGMSHRLGIYQNDVHHTVNAFGRMFSKDARRGIHPIGVDTPTGDRFQRTFQMLDFLFTVVTGRPSPLGGLTDYVTISTAPSSKMPKLVVTLLEVRTDADNPGLSGDGRQTLENILRSTTDDWFREIAPHLTDAELGKTFQDPKGARAYFENRSKSNPGLSVIRLVGLDNDHVCGPQCSPQNYLASLYAHTNPRGNGSDFDYVASSPHGDRLVSGRGPRYGQNTDGDGSNNKE